MKRRPIIVILFPKTCLGYKSGNGKCHENHLLGDESCIKNTCTLKFIRVGTTVNDQNRLLETTLKISGLWCLMPLLTIFQLYRGVRILMLGNDHNRVQGKTIQC
jgi:hypothetical protein